ncbi:unnamed protein product, partial [Meganyctiphanes norvegica]
INNITMAEEHSQNGTTILIKNESPVCKNQSSVQIEAAPEEHQNESMQNDKTDNNDTSGHDKDNKNKRTFSPNGSRSQTINNEPGSWKLFLIKEFSVGTLICIGVVIFYYIIRDCTSKGKAGKGS